MIKTYPQDFTNMLAQAEKYARMKDVFMQEKAPAIFLVGGKRLEANQGYLLRREERA